MPVTTNLQKQAIEQFSTLETASVGQFKQIMPLEDNTKAVAVVRASGGEQAKHDLEHEANLLKILKDNGFPALNTYDGVFEIAPGKFGLVMDYVSNANLIDAKAPDMIKVLLPALMMGVKIDTGKEAWAMQIPRITQTVLSQMKQKNPQQIKDFAENLGTQVKQLLKNIKEKGLVVADLQMLIDPTGKITIIDPLDVLRVVPKNPPEQGVDFVDVVNPQKPNSTQFIKSLNESIDMLVDIAKTCDAIVKAKNENLPQAIGSLMTSVRPKAVSAPSSPVMERRQPESRRPHSAPPALNSQTTRVHTSFNENTVPKEMNKQANRPPAVVASNALLKARVNNPSEAPIRPTANEASRPKGKEPVGDLPAKPKQR